jgi:hypothetical protein
VGERDDPLRPWQRHLPAVIAVAACLFTSKVLARRYLTGDTGDLRVVRGALVVDAALIAWAIWDEWRKRR